MILRCYNLDFIEYCREQGVSTGDCVGGGQLHVETYKQELIASCSPLPVPFPLEKHCELVEQAANNVKNPRKKGKGERWVENFSTSIVADVLLMSNRKVHFTSVNKFDNIFERYEKTKKTLKHARYFRAGVNKHTICDFYSHSNYILLFFEYAQQNKLLIKKPEDIPTFTEAVENQKWSGFKGYIQDKLKTGQVAWGLIGVLNDLVTKNPDSHQETSLDDNEKKMGGKTAYFDSKNRKVTMSEAAASVALRELTMLEGR